MLSGRGHIVLEQPFAKCFGSFAIFEELVNVLVNSLSNHGLPTMVRGYIFYGVIHHRTEFPLSNKGGYAEEWLNSGRYNPSKQRVVNTLSLVLKVYVRSFR